MRIKKSFSKNSTSYSVIKDVVVNGKRTTKIVESLGNEEDILSKHPGVDPLKWAQDYAKKLTEREKEGISTIVKNFSPFNLIETDKQVSFNVGYLFLSKIYYTLKLDKICEDISSRYSFKFDLNEILSLLILARVLYPSSKKSSFEQAKILLGFNPSFDIQDIYKALEILAKESDYIVSEVYGNSNTLVPRSTNVLYYYCANYYFEVEETLGLKHHSISKANLLNPIVQFDLFLDGSGLPLSFSLNKSNINEHTNLTPLEDKILNDFNLSKFVICADAALTSIDKLKYCTCGERGYVKTQSIKNLQDYLKKWLLDPNDWYTIDSRKKVDLSNVDLLENNSIYYKERWINDNGLKEKMFVSFSPKIYRYQKNIEEKQIDQAIKRINCPSSLKMANPNDFNNFIEISGDNDNCDITENSILDLNEDVVQKESIFDGFYAVCSNLEFTPAKILRINQSRWEIEESFRIIKSDFKSRPVYVQRDDRIQAHFLICFLSLLVYRILDLMTNKRFPSNLMIKTLRDMNVMEYANEGFIPLYKRTELTDALHEKFNFRTDTEIITKKYFKRILNDIRKGK